MTNILPYSMPINRTGLEDRLSGVSARVESSGPASAVGQTSDAAGAVDNVAIKAGARVSTASSLREASSLLQVADAGLARIDHKLDEMRALAEVAATAPLSKFDRVVLDGAFSELMGEINSIARETEFNGINPLAGFDQSYGLDGEGSLDISIGSMEVGQFAPDLAKDDLLSQENALKSIVDVDKAKEKVADIREDIAGWQAEISVALGGGGSMALDTIQSFSGLMSEGAEIAAAISRQVVMDALLPHEEASNDEPLKDDAGTDGTDG
jgi:hypothetical protein